MQMHKYRHSSEQIFTVKFEDLVNYPGNIMKEVCKFIQEKYYRDMLAVDGTNSSFRVMRDKPGVRKEVIRKQKYLSRLEIFFIELICGKYMLDYEYTLITQDKKIADVLDTLNFYSCIDWCYVTVRKKETYHKSSK